jgi:sugar lactone lactonase YvrE
VCSRGRQEGELIGNARIVVRRYDGRGLGLHIGMSPDEDYVAGLQTLMTGVAFGESPRWHDGRLWFSDWVAKEVVALSPDGASEVITRVDALPFSIDWLPEGPLVITSGRSLLRLEPDGTHTVHADLSGLTEYGLNEIVVDGRGNVYVNGAEFDLMAGNDFRPGMVSLVAPDGSARRVAEGVAFPNGMAVTPDDSTLILAESYGKKLTAFDIAADGSLSSGRVWADLGDGVPDGICLDAEGAVWYGDVPNKRCVRVREGGEVLQTIHLDLGCFACMLGGEEGRTLFMMVQEWGGTGSMVDGPRTGRVMTAEAPAARAGRP